MRYSHALVLTLAVALGGCETTAADALTLTEDSLALREIQTRRFDTTDEAMVLQSSAALLQDLGFSLDDSEIDVGLIVASKDRTAVETGQVAGAVVGTILLTTLALLMGSNSGDTSVAYDKRQHMRMCLATRPVDDGVTVRITFQRIVWNNKGAVSKREPLQESEHYTEFFDRLSKAVFLEANEL